jgi:hypothetical protein
MKIMKQHIKLSVVMLLFFISARGLANDSTILSPNPYSLWVEAYSKTVNLEVFKSNVVPKTTAGAPHFVTKGEKVFFSYNNPDLATISIEIRDGLDRLVYSEVVTQKESILKSFNFENAFQGFYSIKISTSNQMFSTEIEIF